MTEGEQYGPATEVRTTVLFRKLPAKPKLTPDHRRDIRDFARRLSTTIGGESASFTCLISGDKELQRLNKAFLHHDRPTDVLSFPEESPDGVLGEMAISLDRAGEQAAGFGHTLLPEIQVLMLHGFLHLMGFDHERDHGEMARAERKWRKHFNLPSSLIDRGASANGRQSKSR